MQFNTVVLSQSAICYLMMWSYCYRSGETATASQVRVQLSTVYQFLFIITLLSSATHTKPFSVTRRRPNAEISFSVTSHPDSILQWPSPAHKFITLFPSATHTRQCAVKQAIPRVEFPQWSFHTVIDYYCLLYNGLSLSFHLSPTYDNA